MRSIADPFEFARRGGVIEGEAAVADLPRIAAMQFAAVEDAGVRYSLLGEQDKGGKLFYRLSVDAVLGLQCQRCLDVMVCKVEAETRLLLVPESEPLPDEGLEDDSFDPVHVSRNFDVLSAVEDEVLLSLPIAPMHERCESAKDEVVSRRDSPFAVLERLKQSGRA